MLDLFYVKVIALPTQRYLSPIPSVRMIDAVECPLPLRNNCSRDDAVAANGNVFVRWVARLVRALAKCRSRRGQVHPQESNFDLDDARHEKSVFLPSGHVDASFAQTLGFRYPLRVSVEEMDFYNVFVD